VRVSGKAEENVNATKCSETYQDNVAIEILPHVDITLHDGIERGYVDTATFAAKHARLEESLGTPEPLVADCDDLAVR
jgi:aconitase B